MNKEKLDELYHNLRELCLTEDVFQKDAVAGITSHLTQPQGDYIGLLRFLSYYGEKYVLPHVIGTLNSAVNTHGLRFSRVVELGAGFAWLSVGISNAYTSLPTVNVDKRQWVFTDIVADIEAKNGVKRVLDELKEEDLIVMSELLHCLDNPRATLQPFTKWPILVVEYFPARADYKKSYNDQIKKFGCKPIATVWSVFPDSEILFGSTSTHGIWIVLPLQQKGEKGGNSAQRRQSMEAKVP